MNQIDVTTIIRRGHYLYLTVSRFTFDKFCLDCIDGEQKGCVAGERERRKGERD